MSELGSKQVAIAAIEIATTEGREAEKQAKNRYLQQGIATVAIDYGGDFSTSVPKILERAVVAAKREGVIGELHSEEGAVAGAAHEAVMQIMSKAVGLNLGGKIAIARNGSHISVCIFFEVGLLNLNDVVIGLGHRAI